MPLRLFRDRPFAVINLASLVLGFACYSSLFFFSLYLQQIQGWPAGASGWRMLPQFAAMGIVSLCFGRLSRHVSLRRLMLAGYVLAGLVLLAAATLAPRTHYAIVGSLFGLLGLAMGLAVPATGLLAMAAVEGERAAMASAIMNALRQAGMTMGVAVLGSVMSLRAATLLERAGQVAALAAGFQRRCCWQGWRAWPWPCRCTACRRSKVQARKALGTRGDDIRSRNAAQCSARVAP